MSSPLLELFAKLSLDSSEYEKGLGSAEQKAGGFGEKLKSGFKVAGAAVAAVGTAVAAVGKSIVSETSELASYGDQVDKMSQKVGMSAEAYQQWDYVLKISGTEMANMTTGLKTLTNKLDEAKNGSEDAVSMFDKLGISFDELQTMSREDLFSAAITGFQKMEDSTERAALANDLFGKSGQELAPLFNTSIEETERLKQEVVDLGGVLSSDGVRSAAAFEDNLTAMQTAFNGLKRGIMADALPAFNNLMSGFTKLIIGSDGAQEEIKSGIGDFVAFLTDGVGKIAEIGQTIIPALATAIIENLPVLLPALIGVVMQISSTLIDNLPMIFEVAVDILKTLIGGITEQLPVLLPQLVQVIVEIAKTLTEPEQIGTIIDAAISLIMALVDGIIDAIPILIDAVPVIVTNLIMAIVQNLPKILQKIPELLGKIVSSVIENLPVLIKMIPTIIVELVKAFLDPKNMKQILGIGTELIKGLWNGIKDAGAWLWDKISGFFGGVLSRIKNFFGIKSPSKVFAGIGEMLDRGLAKGIDDYAILAENATDDLAEGVLGAMDDVSAGLPDYNVSANVASGNNALTGLGNTLIMNVYGAVGQDVSELAEIISQKIAFNYDVERRAFA